jgi:hypothetical protein
VFYVSSKLFPVSIGGSRISKKVASSGGKKKKLEAKSMAIQSIIQLYRLNIISLLFGFGVGEPVSLLCEDALRISS